MPAEEILDFRVYNEHLAKRYELLKGIFKTLDLALNTDVDLCRYPYTCNALHFFSKKIDSLTEAICTSFDYYTTQVLYRVVVEHFLIAYYLATKARTTFSDKTGREYYIEYYNSEYLKRSYYKIHIEEKVKKQQAKIDSLKRFNEVNQTNFTQSDVDKLHNVASQFTDVRRIVSYFLHQLPQDDFFKHLNSSLHMMLDAYNLTSSYIHGGPAAYEETFFTLTHDEKERRMMQATNIAKMCSFAIKEQLIYLLSLNHAQYKYVSIPIQQFLKFYEGR
ncbi:MAG: hypothetical protein EOP48_03720 [Sphingobacteriales bacterium]|nr:MAG: hypothetical protein EOP48_03720 [Sphingobacteriales bacterium]